MPRRPVPQHSVVDANVAGLLVRTARCWPRLPAVACGDRALLDYAALASAAARLAGAFEAAGLAPGDRVALVARNVPAYVATLFGCWWAGLVAVPVNAKLHPRELAFVLADSGARWVFADDAGVGEATLAGDTGSAPARVIAFGSAEHARLLRAAPRAAPSPRGADDPAWLFYTSGTTGRPKGVVITHGNLRAMSQCFLSDVEAIAPGDAILHPAPLSHGSGLYVLPHVQAGAVSVVPESGGFDPAETLALLGTWDRALFFAAPTIVKRIVQSPALGHARLDRLKCIVYGGGPMYVADCRAAFAALGPRLAQIYGQGESPMTITAMSRALLADAIARGDDARVGSVGVAQTGIDVRVAGRDDVALPPGETGEVQVRGPTVMRGYWQNPDASAEALANGWLHTGDLGSLDADGFLTLKDRSKDLVISGGANIYPREVEEVLLLHADVAEAAVVGRPHGEWGEEVVACVVARGEAATDPEARRRLEAALDALCLGHVARFKRPRAYVFLAALPKNETGKVLKTVLRERVGAAARRGPQ
jgi:long-chain acyl-CoA synthetase